MRKVKAGMCFREYGSYKPFKIVSVHGGLFAHVKTDRGTIISLSRLTSTKYYKKI